MIDLNKEAEEWAFWGPNSHRWSNNNDTAADNFGSFIAGANSKYVQAKIIQAQIDVLKSIRTVGFEEAFVCLEIYNKVKELQQQFRILS